VLAVVQISAGRYDEARENLQMILQERPDFPFVSNQLTRALFFGGRRSEAIARLEQFSVGRIGVTGWLHAIAGRRTEAEAIAAMFPHLPQRQAEIHGYLGDKEQVFDALDRLAELNPIRAATYLDYPELAVIRGDARVAAMRARLGFPR
jgi:tetratricopeptide (TPR) repeat protein